MHPIRLKVHSSYPPNDEEALNPNSRNDHQDLEAAQEELTSLLLLESGDTTIPTVSSTNGLDHVEGQEQEPLVEQFKTLKTDLKTDLEELLRLELKKTKEDEKKHLVLEELENMKTDLEELRLEFKKTNDDTRSTEGTNGEKPISFPEDTYSLMNVSKRGTRPWMVGLGICIFPLILLISPERLRRGS